MRRFHLRQAPALLGAMMIILPSLLVYGNAIHRLIAGVPMYSDTRLHGVETPVRAPELTWSSLLSGRFSSQFSRHFNASFPLLSLAIQMKGQVYWSLLHESPTWYITVGRKDVLYENSYLDDYCSRNLAAMRPVAQAWADKLMVLQRWYAAQGKVFLYVLTPSKAALEPETIPVGWVCPSSPRDRADFHILYDSILRRAGVNLVDTVETTLIAKGRYKFPPFPPGGTHFNQVSAALAVKQLINVLTTVGSWRRLNDFDFTWHMAEPDEVDTDLLDALNIPFSGIHYLTPSISILPTNVGRCVPIMFAQVGGSFTYQLDKVLQRIPCPPSVDFYEYFRNTMAFYPGDRRYPADAKRRAWSLLDAAQVVMLEENEELAARSKHGEALLELVEQRISATRQPTENGRLSTRHG